MLPTRQRQKNNMPQVMNARAVYGVLGLGFVLLLGLIVYLGRFSSTRLEDLSRGAEEKTRGYSARLQQAVSLRAAVENAIAEARAYQAARESLRVYPVSFSTRFNTARQRLSNEFGKAKTMRAQYGTQMSSAERQQLDEILSYEKPFVDFLVEVREQVDAEAKGKIEERQPREVVTPHDAAADAVLGKDADLLSKRDFAKSQFFSSQNFLLVSSVSWQQRLEDERINLLADIAQQQAAAASSVRSRSFWTWVLGCLIAVATYLIVRYQIKQIRKANKDALEAEGLTTSVLNSLRDDVLAINEQGAVFSVNPAFLNDFHLAQQECLHQDYRTLLGRLPQLRQAVEQASQRAGTTPLPPERVEIKPDGVEGDTRLFDLEIAPRWVGDEVRGHVVVLTDVTEIERNREEAERNRALSRIGQLTAQVGHEIYNPLGAIKLNADLLEMQLPATNAAANDDARQTVARLKRALEHLSTIVLDLRYLSRSREPERKMLELPGLLDEVIELASERLQRAQINVERNYVAENLRGEFDPMQLRKVFLNLLINAIEASPRASAVAIAARRVPAAALKNGFKAERGALVVSVIDHGSGMSAETKRRVFEAFYSTKQHGTGLGMMITHEIIKKHGGKIEVESEEGKGTTIDVYLPL